ncbi:MAG: glutamate-cysteine ligase family protein [Parcubacteria group bacterium]
MTIEQFKSLFKYDQSRVGYVGVERECFTCNRTGDIVPHAHKVLSNLKKNLGFGYELSACQVETRIGPCLLGELHARLSERDEQLNTILKRYGLSALNMEVGPADMPLAIYPDPTGRYQKITKNMPRAIGLDPKICIPTLYD